MISTRHMLAMAAVAALGTGPFCAYANTGTVTHVAGTLSAKKPDGTTRVLSPRSEVGSGDVISTERESHAQIRFADGGEVTLKPNTSLKLETFRFAKDKPKEDSFLTTLLTGGFRMVTGLVGSRSRNKLSVGTATATIGIRGTDFGVLVCQGDCPNLGDGTYSNTYDGTIHHFNRFGDLDCATGHGCFTGRDVAPVRMPEIPREIDFFVPSSFLDKIGGDTVLDRSGHKECVIH